MLGSIGMPELIIIFVIALIIFGPRKLPELGRSLGKSINEFKRASNEFKSQIDSEIAQLDRDTEPQQQILPPEPPVGAIAALSVGPEPHVETAPLESESSTSLTKAPDA